MGKNSTKRRRECEVEVRGAIFRSGLADYSDDLNPYEKGSFDHQRFERIYNKRIVSVRRVNDWFETWF